MSHFFLPPESLRIRLVANWRSKSSSRCCANSAFVSKSSDRSACNSSIRYSRVADRSQCNDLTNQHSTTKRLADSLEVGPGASGMKSKHFASLLVVGLFVFGASASAWCQDCCKRSYTPSCKVATKCDSCRPCFANPLVDALQRIDCALQRLLPCRKSCCKTGCDVKSSCYNKSPSLYGKRARCAKPSCDAKPSCGCGAVGVPIPSEAGEADPFTDDELEPPPIPTVETGHSTQGDSKVARRASPTPAVKATSSSPQRFRPVNASPLPRTVSGQKSALRREGATGSTAKRDEDKKKRALIDPVRLAEFVLH